MPLTILHLSDAHIGRPRDKFSSDAVLKPLLEDLAVMKAKLGPPDLIIFSGDLAYGNLAEMPLAEQFAEVRKWIEQAYSRLGTTLARAPLVVVPGNHDINRGSILPEITKFLAKDADAEEVRKVMQSEPARLREC